MSHTGWGNGWEKKLRRAAKSSARQLQILMASEAATAEELAKSRDQIDRSRRLLGD